MLFLYKLITIEWSFRRKRLKYLYSKRYSFLDQYGFSLNENLYFEGIYKNYYILINPVISNQKDQKSVEFDIISAFYQSESLSAEKEEYLCGEYFIGELYFENQCVSYIPKDWQTPDFLENLDQIVQILKRERLEPISKEDWNEQNLKNLVDETSEDKLAL